jgi:hypothetical protein
MDTEFVLLTLDDFFINDAVNVQELNFMLDCIKQDKSIGVIYLIFQKLRGLTSIENLLSQKI